jgi:hypothetical protein
VKREDIIDGARVFFLLDRRKAGTIKNIKDGWFNVLYDEGFSFNYTIRKYVCFELYP